METHFAWSSADSFGAKLVLLGNNLEKYGLEELLRSKAEILGRGTFGTSFMTELRGKNAVVVKRLKGGCVAEKEFKKKIQELGKISHENLLPLKAYCCNRNERLLVYEYMRMGSLASVLHGEGNENKIPFTWGIRCKVAYGIARAIECLHTRGPNNTCHGNIKSSNVFLTNFLDVRLSEYCIPQLLSPDSQYDITSGYCAPEVTNIFQVSQKSDVYSFGVLLLELLTGKAPINALGKGTGIDLSKWIRQMFQEKPIFDVFDNALVNYKNIGEQMVQLLQLAVCCTFQYPYKRPSIVAVTNQIKVTCNFKK